MNLPRPLVATALAALLATLAVACGDDDNAASDTTVSDTTESAGSVPGEDLPATLDLRPNRVNVEVTDGEVTAIVNIG